MISSVLAPSAGLAVGPKDLDRTQRNLLVGGVVLAHVAMAGILMNAVDPPEMPAPSPAIEVALIAPEPAIEPVAPVVQPTPPAPAPTPAPPRPPTPAPRPVVQNTPTVVASPAPATATDMVVPPAPVAETPPAPPAPVAQPPAPPVTAPAQAPVARAPAQPKEMPSSAVRYLVSPPEVYPRVSKELGETGIVRLRLLIDEHGRLKDITVVQSSGYPRLDQQAVASMRQARFQPYLENGVPREVITTAPIVFSLEDQ